MDERNRLILLYRWMDGWIILFILTPCKMKRYADYLQLCPTRCVYLVFQNVVDLGVFHLKSRISLK